MKRYTYFLIFCLMLFIGFNLSGCNNSKVTGVAFVSSGSETDVMAVSRNGVDGDEFTLYVSPRSDSDSKRSWMDMGAYRGSLVGIAQENGKVLLVFRDGSVMSAGIYPETSELSKVDDSKLSAKPDDTASEEKAKPAAKLETLLEGSGRMLLVDASVNAGRILAVSLDDSRMPHLLSYELSQQSGEWKEITTPLPVLSTPALVRCGFYQNKPVFFWREANNGLPQAGLRGVWYNGGKWDFLPDVPPPLLKGNFAVASYDSRLLLMQQSTFAQSANGVVSVNILTDKGWSFYAPLVPENALQGLGGGVSLSVSGKNAVISLSSMGEVQSFASKNVEAGNWAKINLPGAESEVGIPSWYMYLLIIFSAFAFILAWRAARIRNSAAAAGTGGVETAAEAMKAISASMHGRPATIFTRAIAMFIDAAFIMPLPWLFTGGSLEHAVRTIAQGEQLYVYFVGLAGLAVYAAIAEAMYGQTIGKKLLGIKVRSINGQKVSWSSAIIRNVLRGIDFFPVPIGGADIWYLVAFLTAAFSKYRQRVGDRLASTIVVRFVPLKKRRIVLASASPRRRELLQEMGFTFHAKSADVDESIISGIEPAQMAIMLARKKAEAVAMKEKIPGVIIAADTIVVHEGKILGKPESREDAVRMLSDLSGSNHQVITGVCLVDMSIGAQMEGADVTNVQMRDISPEEIAHYIESGEPEDKAGAYAIQGKGGEFVTEISGSLSNVIGLPVEMLTHMLSELD